MTEARFLLSHSLPNGLTLEMYDLSRHMAGDRWQVVVEVRVPIPVNSATLPPDLADRSSEVIAALGREILFTKQEVRHFIDVREMPTLVREMTSRLAEGVKGYLGHPDFAGRYIRKKFTEYLERQSWYKE